MARMPPTVRTAAGGQQKLATTAAFSNRCLRFRDAERLGTWTPRRGSEPIKELVKRKLASEGANSTSIQGLKITSAEVKKAKALNKGKFASNSRYKAKGRKRELETKEEEEEEEESLPAPKRVRKHPDKKSASSEQATTQTSVPPSLNQYSPLVATEDQPFRTRLQVQDALDRVEESPDTVALFPSIEHESRAVARNRLFADPWMLWFAQIRRLREAEGLEVWRYPLQVPRAVGADGQVHVNVVGVPEAVTGAYVRGDISDDHIVQWREGNIEVYTPAIMPPAPMAPSLTPTPGMLSRLAHPPVPSRLSPLPQAPPATPNRGQPSWPDVLNTFGPLSPRSPTPASLPMVQNPFAASASSVRRGFPAGSSRLLTQQRPFAASLPQAPFGRSVDFDPMRTSLLPTDSPLFGAHPDQSQQIPSSFIETWSYDPAYHPINPTGSPTLAQPWSPTHQMVRQGFRDPTLAPMINPLSDDAPEPFDWQWHEDNPWMDDDGGDQKPS